MKTITRSLLMAALMLAVVNVYAQSDGGDDLLKKKIQAYNNQMVEATLSGDAEKSLSFYSAKAISLPNYGEMLRGIEAISNHQKETEEMGFKITAMKLTTQKVSEYGDALVEIGKFTITLELPEMPQPISDEGKYLTVWEKQADGNYKIAYEIWNTDINPMQEMKGDWQGEPKPNSEENKKLENDGGSNEKPSPEIDKK